MAVGRQNNAAPTGGDTHVRAYRGDAGAERGEIAGRYFSEVLTEVNLVLRVLPMPLTAVTITMLRPAAIRQYSMAVAPDSSLRNLEINCCIQNSFGTPPQDPAPPDAPLKSRYQWLRVH
jgi:hypothetical protein